MPQKWDGIICIPILWASSMLLKGYDWKGGRHDEGYAKSIQSYASKTQRRMA